MPASQLDKFVALGSGCYCSAHGSYLLHSWSSLDEANSPIARQLQRVCHDTLPWLISFSLDLKPHVERYFYSKDGSDVQGPIDVDDLRQMRAEGILTSQTQVCMQGTQTWRPIATVAPTVPATPKQIAYLSYTGVADPDRISKDEVAIVLNKLFDTPDLKLWRQLRQKQEDWATDRFILYHDLYARDIEYMLHEELPRAFHAFVRSRMVGASETSFRPEMRSVSSSSTQFDDRARQLRGTDDVVSAIATATADGQIPE